MLILLTTLASFSEGGGAPPQKELPILVCEDGRQARCTDYTEEEAQYICKNHGGIAYNGCGPSPMLVLPPVSTSPPLERDLQFKPYTEPMHPQRKGTRELLWAWTVPSVVVGAGLVCLGAHEKEDRVIYVGVTLATAGILTDMISGAYSTP